MKEELTAAMASYAASAVDGPEHPALVDRTRNATGEEGCDGEVHDRQGDSGAHGPPCLHSRPSVAMKAAPAAPAVPHPSGERATTPDKAVLRASQPWASRPS